MDTLKLPPTSSLVRIALWLALVGCFTGCASSTAYVVARRDAQFNLSSTNKFTLATHPAPNKATQALQQALVAALQERGMELVPPAEAEFTLTYWLDDAWKPGKKVVYFQSGEIYSTTPERMVFAPYGTSLNAEPIIPRVVDSHYYVQGIRLKLYPKASASAGQFQAAWEGYIEGGDRVSARREPVLLRTLLHYFGQNFVGRAKLAQ